MYGKAQAPVLGPFSILSLQNNCLKLLRIALSDPHGLFQSMFSTNKEEQSHRQNAITQGGSVMHNKNISPEGAVRESGSNTKRPSSDNAQGILTYNEV